MRKLAHLPGRRVLAVRGPDRVSFLQGLVSNDVAAVAPGRAVWAALLTPQGKYLADFFIRPAADPETLLLDCEADAADTVASRLARFRLRAKVEIAPVSTHVHAVWNGAPETGMDAVPDPRLPEAGFRVLAATPLLGNADATEYDRHRLALGLPDGARDIEPERSVLLEAGFDELGGVSWTKGCYMGQELTARTRYRGLLKRRLVPVALREGVLPPPGTPLLADGREAGTMRSGLERAGLATVRLEHLHTTLKTEEGARLEPHVPAWMVLAETAGGASAG